MGDRTRIKAPSVHAGDDYTMAGLNITGFSSVRNAQVNLDVLGDASLYVLDAGVAHFEVETDVKKTSVKAFRVWNELDEICLNVDTLNHKVFICNLEVGGSVTFGGDTIINGGNTIINGTNLCVNTTNTSFRDNVITLNEGCNPANSIPGQYTGVGGFDVKVGNSYGDGHVGLQWNGGLGIKEWQIQVDETVATSFRPIAYVGPSLSGNLSRTDLLAGTTAIGFIAGSLPNLNPPFNTVQSALEVIDFKINLASAAASKAVYFLTGAEVAANALDTSRGVDQGIQVDLGTLADNASFTNEVQVFWNGMLLLNETTTRTGPTDISFDNDVARKTSDLSTLVFNNAQTTPDNCITFQLGDIIQIIDARTS